MKLGVLANVKFEVNSELVREETKQGIKYLVAAAVIMVEGVHAGSSGPLFYPRAELSKFPQAWNGRPLPIDHPVNEGGVPISCNTPELVEATVGVLWNSTYVDGKLKAELWVDIAKARAKAPSILSTLHGHGGLLELSTGLFSEHDNTPGEWNGKSYIATVLNIRPDHVALLPNGQGACAVHDGCGAPRTNEAGKKLPAANDHRQSGAITNEMSFDEIRMKLQREVDKLDTPMALHFVIDVYDGFVIYRKESAQEGVTSQLFKQGYSISNDGEVTLSEEVIEVKEKTEYVPVANTNGKEDTKVAEKKIDKCCPEKVAALIGHKKSPFEEKDKDWLEGLNEEALKKVSDPFINEDGSIKEFKTEEPPAAEGSKEKKETGPVEKKEEEHPAASPKPATAAEFLADKTIPEEVRDTLSEAMKTHEARKQALIKTLTENGKCPFSAEELKAMKPDGLEKLVTLSGQEVPVVNYAAAPGAVVAQVDNEGDGVPNPPVLFAENVAVAKSNGDNK